MGRSPTAGTRACPGAFPKSGYYAFDADQNYQYRAFGVPGLGFKRNLAEDLVVAPYASLLALSLRPRKVMENIARLDGLDDAGRRTASTRRLTSRPRACRSARTHAIVREYMAHHQGMILLALANYLHGQTSMVRRFHADPRVQSVDLLLQERVPYDVPLEVRCSRRTCAPPERSVRAGQRFAVERAGAGARCRTSITFRMGITAC